PAKYARIWFAASRSRGSAEAAVSRPNLTPLSPSAFRSRRSVPMGVLALWIPATEPFDGRSLLGFLESRAVAGVEEVTGGSYRRSVSLKNGTGVVSVSPEADGVRAELDLEDPADADEAATRIGHLFDLDADPDAITSVLGSGPLLG